MSELPSTRKLLLLGIPIILVVVVLLVIFALPASPLSPFHICTMMACRDSLEITLSHEPPGQYLVQVKSSTGSTVNAACTSGEDNISHSLAFICHAGKVTFYDFAPSDVTIDISWQAGNYSTSGHPSYKSFRPNGPGCDPVCKVGELQVEIP